MPGGIGNLSFTSNGDLFPGGARVAGVKIGAGLKSAADQGKAQVPGFADGGATAGWNIPRAPGVGVGTMTGTTPLVDSGNVAAYGGYAATPGSEAALLNQRFNPFRYLLTGQEPAGGIPAYSDSYARGGQVAPGGVAAYAQILRDRGRGNDTILAHINPREAALLRAHGGSGKINPHTGLPEFDDGDGGDGGGDAGSGGPGSDSVGASADNGGFGGFDGPGFGGDAAPGNEAGLGSGPSAPGSSGEADGNAGLAADAAANAMGIGSPAGMPGFDGPGVTAAGPVGSDEVGFGLGPAMGAPASNANGMMASIGRGVMGMVAGPMAGPASVALNNALGVASPASSAASALGMVGLAAAGPVGAMAGAAIGAALGGTLGSHGENGIGMNGIGSTSGIGGSQGGASGRGMNETDDDRRRRELQALMETLTPKSFARGGTVREDRAGFHSRKFSRGSGLVHGDTGGRDDALHVTVPTGSYVVPADAVAAAGGGNTAAGGKRLAQSMPRDGTRFASGGIAGEPSSVPIRVSSGEFVVHPAHVAALGQGSPEMGAQALDQLVASLRQANAQTVAAMPGPR